MRPRPYYQKKLKSLDPNSVEYLIYRYLTEHAVGHKNAKSWKEIRSQLNLSVRQQFFQHGLLKYSRENSFYIGSSTKGYFIIVDSTDYSTALNYINNRIESEKAHRSNLMSLEKQLEL